MLANILANQVCPAATKKNNPFELLQRDALEKKLSESREQLSDVKSTWSDKITHLEQQISHLNTKIAEDAQEMSHIQQEAVRTKDSLQSQVRGWVQ